MDGGERGEITSLMLLSSVVAFVVDLLSPFNACTIPSANSASPCRLLTFAYSFSLFGCMLWIYVRC